MQKHRTTWPTFNLSGEKKMATTSTNLADLASKINADYTTLQSGDKQRRRLVIDIGKSLLRAKKECKAEGQEFGEWCKCSLGGTFSSRNQVSKYMAIARYPSVFKGDMSINEGAKLCNYARQHGGEVPSKEWKGGVNRTPIVYQRKVGKMLTATRRMLDTKDLAAKAEEEQWTTDERLGMVESLEQTRTDINTLLRRLKEICPQST
jgi:hypothetical protein